MPTPRGRRRPNLLVVCSCCRSCVILCSCVISWMFIMNGFIALFRGPCCHISYYVIISPPFFYQQPLLTCGCTCHHSNKYCTCYSSCTCSCFSLLSHVPNYSKATETDSDHLAVSTLTQFACPSLSHVSNCYSAHNSTSIANQLTWFTPAIQSERVCTPLNILHVDALLYSLAYTGFAILQHSGYNATSVEPYVCFKLFPVQLFDLTWPLAFSV